MKISETFVLSQIFILTHVVSCAGSVLEYRTLSQKVREKVFTNYSKNLPPRMVISKSVDDKTENRTTAEDENGNNADVSRSDNDHDTSENITDNNNSEDTGMLFFELSVGLNFQLISILDLNEADQVLTFSGELEFKWLDLDLAWDVQEYRIGEIDVSISDVWTPSPLVLNNANSQEDITMQPDIKLFSDGELEMTSINVFKTVCNVDVKQFPFDEQECSLILVPTHGVSWDLSIMKSDISISSSEWQIVSLTASLTSSKIANAVFTFHLKRQSMYYIVSIIFPMALLSYMNAFVFLLPADSGEKMSFLVSMFLSYAVFLNFINEIIPKSGELPHLSIYLLLILCQSALAIIATLVVLNLHTCSRNTVEPELSPSPVQDEKTPKSSFTPSKKLDFVFFVIFFIYSSVCLGVYLTGYSN